MKLRGDSQGTHIILPIDCEMDRSLCGIMWNGNRSLKPGTTHTSVTCPECKRIWEWLVKEHENRGML